MWAKCEEMDVSSIMQVGKMTLRESLSRDSVGHGKVTRYQTCICLSIKSLGRGGH